MIYTVPAGIADTERLHVMNPRGDRKESWSMLQLRPYQEESVTDLIQALREDGG